MPTPLTNGDIVIYGVWREGRPLECLACRGRRGATALAVLLSGRHSLVNHLITHHHGITLWQYWRFFVRKEESEVELITL